MKIFLVQFLFALFLSVKGAELEYSANGLINLFNDYSIEKSIDKGLFRAAIRQYYKRDSLGS
jgi:hypothetical protein